MKINDELMRNVCIVEQVENLVKDKKVNKLFNFHPFNLLKQSPYHIFTF